MGERDKKKKKTETVCDVSVYEGYISLILEHAVKNTPFNKICPNAMTNKRCPHKFRPTEKKNAEASKQLFAKPLNSSEKKGQVPQCTLYILINFTNIFQAKIKTTPQIHILIHI